MLTDNDFKTLLRMTSSLRNVHHAMLLLTQDDVPPVPTHIATMGDFDYVFSHAEWKIKSQYRVNHDPIKVPDHMERINEFLEILHKNSHIRYTFYAAFYTNVETFNRLLTLHYEGMKNNTPDVWALMIKDFKLSPETLQTPFYPEFARSIEDFDTYVSHLNYRNSHETTLFL